MKDSRIAQSIKARLLNMSDSDNKKYQQLIVRFFHERLLYRLSKSNYRERFILKGGALLFAYQEFIPRPTLDIDFMGNSIDNDKANILDCFKQIASINFEEDGLKFMVDTMRAEDIIVEKEYPGVRISLEAILGSYRQKLTMDIGFGDVIVPHPMELEYPTLLDSMEEPMVMAYSLETVVAEKFQTMIDRGRINSRMKDYFDLYRIFSVHEFEGQSLSDAIAATFSNRGTEFVEDHDFFRDDFGKDTMLTWQWINYKQKIRIDLPDFELVHKFIRHRVMDYWKNLQN